MQPLRVTLAMVESPLPFGNAVSRWYYVLVKGLVERGHRLTALAACSKAEELQAIRDVFPAPAYNVRGFRHGVHAGLTGKLATLRRPHSYLFSPEMKQAFRDEVAQGCDILHLESLWTGWLAFEHRRRALLNIHYLFQIDLSETVPKSAAHRLRLQMDNRAERYLIGKYANVCTLTPRLSAEVRKFNPAARVFTVPLGMDLSLYPFQDRGAGNADPVVGLIGAFNWMPTYSAAVRLLTRLWPAIKRRVPNAKLHFVSRLARQVFPDVDDPDISLYDTDSMSFFRNTDVLVYAPSRGSGMKVKVLEGFALGTPVVTTGEGVEGIPAEDGVHAGIAEDDAGLIDRTVALLQSAELRGRRVRAARELLEKHCGAGPTLDAMENVYAEMLDLKKPAESKQTGKLIHT